MARVRPPVLADPDPHSEAVSEFRPEPVDLRWRSRDGRCHAKSA